MDPSDVVTLTPTAHRRSTDIATLFPDDVVLLVGEQMGPLPQIDAVRFARDPMEAYGLVAILPGANFEETLARLEEVGRLAVPVADLRGLPNERADYHGPTVSEETLKYALLATQPIRRALNSFAPAAGGTNRRILTALTLAVSRQMPIEATWTGGTRDLVEYSLLTGLGECRSMLDEMVQSGLLKRRFFDRLHVCVSCGSARMPVREVCPSCESPQLNEESLVHHYRCAYQGPRSQFDHGQSLICPKCSRALRHYGVDYDNPGLVHACGQCDERFAEPDVAFVCADCGTGVAGHKADRKDWYHYDVTPEAARLVKSGGHPATGTEPVGNGSEGGRAAYDLALLIEQAEKVRRSFGSAFTVVQIDFDFKDGVAPLDRARAGTLARDVALGALRDPDHAATLENRFVLLLPETTHETALKVVEHIKKRLASVTELASKLSTQFVNEAQLPALLDSLRRV